VLVVVVGLEKVFRPVAVEPEGAVRLALML
jgi:hypothetical protein